MSIPKIVTPITITLKNDDNIIDDILEEISRVENEHSIIYCIVVLHDFIVGTVGYTLEYIKNNQLDSDTCYNIIDMFYTNDMKSHDTIELNETYKLTICKNVVKKYLHTKSARNII